MVVKLKTNDGTPVHLEVPWTVWVSLLGFLLTIAGAALGSWAQVRTHEQRISAIEESVSTFVPRAEIESSVTSRLDRIEDKLERLLEAR